MRRIKMKRIISILMFLFVLFLSACNTPSSSSKLPENGLSNTPDSKLPDALYEYFTFEEALLEYPPTVVVIAQYVGQKPFGEYLTEYEFAVQERIINNAADRIFVYVENINAKVEKDIVFRPEDINFDTKTEYLLPLRKLTSVYGKTHENGFVFLRNIIIDLNTPSNSIMYSESLSKHSTGLDLASKNVTRQQIISYVYELTKNNPPARTFIKSEVTEDIIEGSPYVVVVEINKPLRLRNEQDTKDWMETDIYYTTVIQTLKGDVKDGDELVVIFFADTVFPGERHIVALASTYEEGSWYHFSSRNSLFSMEQQKQIEEILGVR